MTAPIAFYLPRCVLEFRGADIVRFLNGQLSNDVRKLTSEAAMHACVMTAKGRMNAEVWLTKLEDAIRVDGPPGLGEELLLRFERYVISDDVSISDVSSEQHLTHTIGAGAGIQARRFKVTGVDHWQTTPVESVNSDAAEYFRIAQGIPAWGKELDENTIPVEAGLDLDCIDYHKGCYIGQEVISRLKSIGHVNRILVRLTAPLDIALSAGSVLSVAGKDIGQVTSAAKSLELKNIVALAYVKRSYAAPDTPVQLPGGEILTVQPLQT